MRILIHLQREIFRSSGYMNPRALYTEITLPRRIRPSQHTDIHGLRSVAVHFNLYFQLVARHGVPRTQDATSAPTKAIYQTILQVSQRSGSSPSLDPSTTVAAGLCERLRLSVKVRSVLPVRLELLPGQDVCLAENICRHRRTLLLSLQMSIC